MKYLTVILCLLLSLNALAQKKDTVKAETMYDLLDQVKKQPGVSNPVVLVDDSVFKGDLHSIKSDDVAEVQVVKGTDMSKFYGKGDKEGVFIIKTKKGMFGGMPQPDIINLPPKQGNVAYIVDGVPVEKGSIDTNQIFIRQSVSAKKLQEAGFYPDQKLDSAILIITRKDAIKTYQKKFSAISKEYKEYLNIYKGDDSTCFYFIDGQGVARDQDDFIKKLYEIPAGKILSITLQHPAQTDNFAGVNVRITTKQ